jgi:hypothetical protein
MQFRNRLEVDQVLNDLDRELADRFPQQEAVMRGADEITVDIWRIDANCFDVAVDEPRSRIRRKTGAPFDPFAGILVWAVAKRAACPVCTMSPVAS